MTPRNEMLAGPNELTECMWFESLLSKVAQDAPHFFLDTYEEIYHKHLEVGAMSAAKNSIDNWKD